MGQAHARIIGNLSNLVSIFDVDEYRAINLSKKHGCVPTSNLDDLEKIKFDLAVISSTTETHFFWAEKLLKKGIPVLIEKPISENVSETLDLINLSTKHKCVLYCSLPERFNPTILEIKDKKLNPHFIEILRHSGNIDTSRRLPGIVYDLLIHDIDLLLNIFHFNIENFSIIKESSFRGNKEYINNNLVNLHATNRNGVIVSLSASRISQKKIRKILIYEENAYHELDLISKEINIYAKSKQEFKQNGKVFSQESMLSTPNIQHFQEPLAVQFEQFLHLIELGVESLEYQNYIEGITKLHKIIDKLENNNPL